MYITLNSEIKIWKLWKCSNALIACMFCAYVSCWVFKLAVCLNIPTDLSLSLAIFYCSIAVWFAYWLANKEVPCLACWLVFVVISSMFPLVILAAIICYLVKPQNHATV